MTGPTVATGAPAAAVVQLLLADSRLPVGAHTQSAGLEGALAAGMPVHDVPRYIDARLRTVTLVEASAAVLALTALAPADGTPAAGWPVDPDPARRLAAVDAAWHARSVSPALRENSRLLGRGLLRLAARLWPDASAVRAVRALGRPSRAVVLGAVGSAAGLAPADLATVLGYDDAQTVAAAALKLVPMDPVEATSWVLHAAPAIAGMAARAAAVRTPEDLPAAAAPLVEAWAEAHAEASARLFRS
ncbi:urease accessory protein UreF [Nakamurella endophytica]|uniref:Urease accessory protein UreF n=1 Tax=Nakamurella endophytica TaxID=1748367 RepID=A0A917T659_9ACTN|nr:urease accessory UreF family protein [Nakamurella endophytica]GGM11178.1 urease accessory protein UreF [Nakamurella endophytica]